MSDLLAARSQMGVSLAFHIIFAVVGIAMPLMMVVAERRWQVTGHEIYLDLAKRWSRGTAILFAVGAVSGTVLFFELGGARADGPHDPCRLRRDRVRRRGDPRVPAAQGSRQRVPPARADDRLDRRRPGRGAAAALGGPRGAPPGGPSAREARRRRGAVRDAEGRPAHHRGLAGRGDARDQLADRDPPGALAPRV